MVNENLKVIVENKKPVEEVREVENYQIKKSPLSLTARGKVVNKSGSNFRSEKEGHGPCMNSWCGCDCSSYTCDCSSAEASIYKKGAFSIGNCSASGKGRTRNTGSEKGRVIANGQASRSLFRLKDHTGDLKILSDTVGGEIGKTPEGYTARIKASADVIKFKSGGFEGRAGISVDTGLKKDDDGREIKLAGFGVSIGKKAGISTPVGEIKVDTDECIIQ